MDRMIPPAATLAAGLLLALALPLAGGQIVCHFKDDTTAAVNDFGDRHGSAGLALSASGTGCPADPAGRALDAATPAGLDLPVSPQTSLAQGTLEAWVRTRWDWATDRDHHSFLSIKMEGGHWQSLALYHHGRMGESRTLAFNIHDGVDNCITCPVEQLGWGPNQWHHLAASWTEHSEWLFADGRLVAKRLFKDPMAFAAPEGPLRIGPPGLWGSAADTLIDEVRFSDQPLYVGLETIPVPTAPLADAPAPGLVSAGAIRVSASSTAAPLAREDDVPELHDGVFGQTVWLQRSGQSWVRCDLPTGSMVAAVRWSRDGRPLAGASDWADARNLPRDFTIEVSQDGETWQQVLSQNDFWYEPAAIPRTGMVFEHRFPPVSARGVRMGVTKAQPGSLGPQAALDEFQVLDVAGQNLAAQARLVTPRTLFRRQYRPENLLDGRLGEESCWRAAQPGEAEVALTFAGPCEVHALTWSRSAEGLAGDGTPRDLVVEARRDGQWAEVARLTGNQEPGRHDMALVPTRTTSLRLRVLSTVDGKEAVLDEISLR